MDFRKISEKPLVNIEKTLSEPAAETPPTPADSGFSAADRFEHINLNFMDAVGAAERSLNVITTEDIVQSLLDASKSQDQAGRIRPDRESMLDTLAKLSPEQFKAVMQSLMDKGEFTNIIGIVSGNRLGSILGEMMQSAQSDPALLDTIVKIIDTAGAEKVFPGIVAADPQSLKLLPERQLLKMLIASEGSSLWGKFYQAIELKGPSPAGQKVLIDEAVEYLTREANAVPPFENLPPDRSAGIRDMLLSLNSQDYKEVIGKLQDSGKFLPLLESFSTSSDAGVILGDLLQRAQNDPDLMSLLQQTLNDPTITNNSSLEFVLNATPQTLSALPEDTLMKLMDACEGMPQWDTVFTALELKNPS